ncbi:MAG: hypothetical protein VKO21_09665 [Candidatus Sericytochromatia bacterium]|nr:hypothetical protein [Candidatus Sericytochromatia bacterium]
MDAVQREALATALRKAAELLAGATSPQVVRKDVLAACRKVQEAFLALGFDEQASRKRLVHFMRSMELANGVIGARTGQRLMTRTFEEEAELAEKWMLEQGLLLDQGDEGIVLTEAGIAYLTQHRAEFPVLGGAERRGQRGGRDHQHARGGRAATQAANRPVQPVADRPEPTVAEQTPLAVQGPEAAVNEGSAVPNDSDTLEG